MDKQALIDNFIAEHPEYAKKQLEIEIYDGKYDINMIKRNGKKEMLPSVAFCKPTHNCFLLNRCKLWMSFS